ncbi:MAG: folylpolyglutamate synthase/dihydrofolate synthase family protein [Oscillospiraceae bacterium]
MNYNEALDYIHSISWRGSKLGLERTQELLEKLGNPEKELKFVHIAGTNGKGSIAAMTASILRKSGYKTGLFTSPAIQEFNERMQVNGEMIPQKELAELMTDYIRPNVEKMSDPTTEFEMMTCLALLWFKKCGCDIVVLEVGMGGEYDSTNVISCPLVAVISAIGLDHMAELGDTIEKIAFAKAGIIKHGGEVVINGNCPEANRVFAHVCNERSAGLTIPAYSTLVKSDSNFKGQYFSYKHYNDLFIPLIGDYQPQNAAVAIETALLLKWMGYRITDVTIRAGLHDVKWPGRFELIGDKPTFIVDGGHNPHGIRGTVDSIKRFLPDTKPVILVGIMADKDVNAILQILCEVSDNFVTVTPDNPRAMKAEELCTKLLALGCTAQSCNTVESGIETAKRIAGESGAVVALGSLYMVGTIRKYYHKDW